MTSRRDDEGINNNDDDDAHLIQQTDTSAPLEDSDDTLDTTRPRLPPEILLQILLSPLLSPVLSPSPLTDSTLQSLLLVSRLTHACAQSHLQSVILLPRRVRDFRKWYDSQRLKGWPQASDGGQTRAVFCALDDVSRLTHTSAGWESCFLRTLHILGPGVTHLSLWHSESRILLRDAGQVRGRHRRLGALGPAWAWGEGEEFDEYDSSEAEEGGGDGEDGDGEEGRKAVVDSAAELAAMRERARQHMPLWLRRELETKPAAEVARTHRAHLAPYGDVDDAIASITSASSSNGAPEATDPLTAHEHAQRKDRRRLRGCRPTSLSLILSLPLFENQEPALFASMLVFSRCKHLDAFFPVPSHAPKLLWLVSHLVRSPLKRLKLSSTHATLVLGVPPFDGEQEARMERREAREGARRRARGKGGSASRRGQQQQQPINLALGLRAILEDGPLRDLLHWEFAGKHVDGTRQLEQALTAVVQEKGRRRAPAATAAPEPSSNDDDDDDDGYGGQNGAQRDEDVEPVRVRIFQRNQGGYGRMKDRREDFIQQSMGLGQGVWAKCGLWDETTKGGSEES